MILWRRFLFCRCFRASWATAIAVVMSASPPMLSEVACTAWRICPCSFVCVTRTSGLISAPNDQKRQHLQTQRTRNSPLASHCHDPDRVFRIRVDLCPEHCVDGICLRSEPGWEIIAVAHVLRVVNNHHGRFQRHLGLWAGWVWGYACSSKRSRLDLRVPIRCDPNPSFRPSCRRSPSW